MKKLSLAISLLYGTTMLHGCASTTTTSQNWKVEPFQQIQHATNRPDGYYRLGRYYQGQNRLELAIESYQKALAIDPHFTDAHNGLGTVYASQGKYEQALAEFNAVIATAPGAAHIYNNLGYLNFLEGNYTEAVIAFTHATSLDPGNEKARNNLSMAMAKIDSPMKPNQAVAQATASPPAAQSGTDNDSNRVASISQSDPLPAAVIPAEAHENIAVAPTNKPDSGTVEPLESVNTGGNKAPSPVEFAQPALQPPFAVLEKPNPKAMPVVLVSGEPVLNTVQEVHAKPIVPAKIPSAVNQVNASSPKPAKAVSAEKPLSNAGLVTTPPKAIAVETIPGKVAQNRIVKSAPPPGVRKYELEVANGNGIKHFAAKFGAMLSAKGLPQASLTNLKPYNQARTVIQYRKGYLFEAARLSRHLRSIQHLAFVVESKDLSPNTDVKLILGKDLSGKLQQISNPKPITLASR